MNKNDQEGLFQSVDQLPAKISRTQQHISLEQLDQQRVRITDLHPIEQKNIKPSDLQFDIKLGWMPRAQISGPIPIAYAHPDMDDLINQNLGSMLYLGYRPSNSFDIHKCFYDSGKKYPFNQFHLCKSKFLEGFFKKYYSDFQFHCSRKQGMLFDDCQLTFNSFFQGGNLDAVYFHQEQYRLILRVDTNTRGHCNYYHFKIKNKNPGRYKFRIMNMSKAKSLYQRGKRPYIKSKKGDKIWRQGCQKVRYGLSPLSQQYQLTKKIYCLKFQYQFTQPNDEVQFCYGIPFVYSELLSTLDSYRSHPHFYLNKLCYSLSGIEVPLVTITENFQSSQDSENKSVIIIIGRAHPGQTHGSHIINGFIRSLLQNKPQQILMRKNLIIKIVPMINPDGVIIGNTRTSLTGKDLNRVYSNRTDFVFPQIIGIRDFTKKLKQKYGKRLLFLIDVHGHSTRKNSFFFGPEFPVFDEQYNKCRMLARIFANRTEIFRYYSCKFRLSAIKERTCRGYFNNKDIVRAYTHQTSMHCYFDFDTRKDKVFLKSQLQGLGQKLMYSIHEYLSIILNLKEIPISDPVNKKKKQRKNEINQEQQQEDSDEMVSDRADSEDSNDDFGNNQMKMFWNRINENRQYFYQELCALNKITKAQPIKKQKKQRYDSSDEQPPKKVVATIINPVLDNSKVHTQVPKLQLNPKKKTNLQEYDKISNVIFGVTTSVFNDKSSQFLYTKTKFSQHSQNIQNTHNNINKVNLPAQRNTRYSFLNVNMNTVQLKDVRNTKVNKLYQTKIATTSLKNFDKRQSQFESVSPSNLISQKPKLFDSEGMRKFLGDSKPLNLLGQRKFKVINQSEPKITRTIFQGTTVRFLPRKKSIKNIRDEDKFVQKKIAKNMRQQGLSKKLPSLNKLYNT